MLFGLSLALTQSPLLTPGDVSAPLLQSATVDAAALLLTYDETLSEVSVPAAADFDVTVNATARSVIAVAVSGPTVTLTLVSAVTQGQEVTLSYTPGANPMQDLAGNPVAELLDRDVVNETADTTAPTLSLASATATGQTTFDWSVSTDEAGGALYWVTSSAATVPSVAQVKAGQDHTGSAAAASGNQPVSTTGSQGGSGSDLAAETVYTWFALHSDAAGNESNIASDGFTTQAPVVGVPVIQTTAISLGALNNETITGEETLVATNSPTSWAKTGGGTVASLIEVTADGKLRPASGWSSTPMTGTVEITATNAEGTSAPQMVTVTAVPDAYYMAHRGVTGTLELEDVLNLGAALAGKTVFIRPGEYDVRGAGNLPIGTGRIRFPGKLQDLPDWVHFTAADQANMPILNSWILGAGTGTVQQKIKFSFIDFFEKCTAAEAAPLGTGRDFKIVSNQNGTIREITFEDCVVRSDMPPGRTGFFPDHPTNDAGNYIISGLAFEADQVIVRRCRTHNLHQNVINASDFMFEENEHFDAWGDQLQISIKKDQKNIIVRNNIYWDKTANARNIHGDGFQIQTDNLPVGVDAKVENLYVHGNKVFPGFEGVRHPPIINGWTSIVEQTAAAVTLDNTAVATLQFFDAAAGNQTITLPDPATTLSGDLIQTQRVDQSANTCRIVPPAGATLTYRGQQVSELPLTAQWMGYRLQSDGTGDWLAQIHGLQMQSRIIQDKKKRVIFDNVVITHDLLMQSGSNAATFQIENELTKNLMVDRVTAVRVYPGDINNDGSVNNADGFNEGSGASITTRGDRSNIIISSVAEGFGASDYGGIVADNNHLIVGASTSPVGNVPAVMTDIFNGTTFDPQTAVELVSDLTPKPGGILDTQSIGAIGGAWNWSTRDWNTQSAPTAIVSPTPNTTDANPAVLPYLEFDQPVLFGDASVIIRERDTPANIVRTFNPWSDRGNIQFVSGDYDAAGYLFRSVDKATGKVRVYFAPPSGAGSYNNGAGFIDATVYEIVVSAGAFTAYDGTGIAATTYEFTAIFEAPSANIFPFGIADLSDTALWQPTNKTVTGPAADGGYTITDTGPSDRLRYDSNFFIGEDLVDGQPYTFALKVKRGDTDDFAVQFIVGLVANERVTFNTATGVWDSATNVALDFDAQDGDGFWRIYMSWTQSSSRLLLDLVSAFATGREHIAKEPMLYEGLVSMVGKLPYEDPDL